MHCVNFSHYFQGDKTVRVYSAKNFAELPYSPIKVFRYGVNFVAFDKKGKYFASASNDGKAHIFHPTKTEAKVIYNLVLLTSLLYIL